MAGNPFRRAQASRSSEYGTRDDSTPTPSNTTSKKKKVTIQTPAQSPEELPLSAGRFSPPPPAQTINADDDSDSTTTAESELEQALANTRRNSGSLQHIPAPGPPVTGAPYNPFARTLATSEASFGLQQPREVQQEGERTDEEGVRGGASRPALDVDAFKNILMTGSAAPSPPTSMRSQRPQDSSSNTDASSISRSSLFDPYLEAHPESPRTSFDQDDSPSASDNDAESSTLMSGPGRLDDLAPPAPPKHSHGKPLAPKGPQTVSFADFEESFATSRGSTPPVKSDYRVNTGPPKMRRMPSDLNKPLPPPPQDPTSPVQAIFSHMVSSQPPTQQTMPTDPTAEQVLQSKRAPPPLPTSRRAGQTMPGHTRVRSTSNASQKSSHAQEPSFSSKSVESTLKTGGTSVPPPPPSRKARPTSQPAIPVLGPSPEDLTIAPGSSEGKVMPPPPPRRNPSKTGSAVHRVSSSASQSSSPQREAHVSTNQNAPPAPPPRRGANSQRASMDSPRPTGETRRTSDNEVRKTSTASSETTQLAPRSNLQQAEPSESHDILSDLRAFQEEVDRLRQTEKG